MLTLNPIDSETTPIKKQKLLLMGHVWKDSSTSLFPINNLLKENLVESIFCALSNGAKMTKIG